MTETDPFTPEEEAALTALRAALAEDAARRPEQDWPWHVLVHFPNGGVQTMGTVAVTADDADANVRDLLRAARPEVADLVTTEISLVPERDPGPEPPPNRWWDTPDPQRYEGASIGSVS
jgi:hypothetical protein